MEAYIYPLARILWCTSLANGCTSIYPSQIYTVGFSMLCFRIYIICETFYIKWRKQGAVPTNPPARIGSSPVLHCSHFPAVPALRGSRSCVWDPALGFSAASVAPDRHTG